MFQRELPGVNFNFSQYIQDNIEEAISGVKAVNSVKIIGPNLETLTQLAEQVREEMSRIRGRDGPRDVSRCSDSRISTSRSIAAGPRGTA